MFLHYNPSPKALCFGNLIPNQELNMFQFKAIRILSRAATLCRNKLNPQKTRLSLGRLRIVPSIRRVTLLDTFGFVMDCSSKTTQMNRMES